ncbi:unnamed protein product [Trichobilharzia szidati]|nr:unnamed protein product [Trichobilharzia szidati]
MSGTQIKTNEPQYENWLGAHSSKNDKHHPSVKTSFPDVNFPRGLQLSARRGPEVELYDVAGVHLLCPPDSQPNNRGSGHIWSKLCLLKSYFHFKGRNTLSPTDDSPIILSNKSTNFKSNAFNEFSPSHLPTKATQYPSSSNNNQTQTQTHGVLLSSSYSSSSRHLVKQRTHISNIIGRLFNWFTLNSSNHDLDHYSHPYLSPKVYRYYKNYFILKYRQAEINVFIFLNLIVCIFFMLTLSLYPSDSSSSNSFDLPTDHNSGHNTPTLQHSYILPNLHLTHPNLIRLILLTSSSVLLLLSSFFANLPCISSNLRAENSLSSKSSWKTKVAGKSVYNNDNTTDYEGQNKSRECDTQEIVNLILAQKLRRNLRWAYGLSYVACILIILANLPWFKSYQISSNSYINHPFVQQFNCNSPVAYKKNNSTGYINQITIVHHPQSNNNNNPGSFEYTKHMSDNLWSLIFSIILILSFFDIDSIWPKYLRYSLTLSVSLLYFILTNVNYALTHFETLKLPNIFENNTFLLNTSLTTTTLCPGWIQKATFIQPVSWWTDHKGILWRSNIATLCAIFCAHLIGQAVAIWTSRHRYRLFLTAGYAQAVLYRLQMTESKLHRLARCLVPAPLAEDLVNDFVNGHLSWSSPLVIYLRNVTFLSAELIGLSNLSATLSSLSKSTGTNYELICQQFVSFINDIFTCFDHLAQSESCYRVRLNADEYLCIAGYPETRVDHARSCIDLGLNMLKIIREINEISHVRLELRVSVHTGTAYAIVLGRSRLGFDLIGDDVSYVSRLKYSTYRPGRVLTSRSTFSQLPEGFRGEAGPVLGYPNPVIIQSNESVKSNNSATHHQQQTTMETYFVQPRNKSSNTNQLHPVDLNESNPSNEWPTLVNLDCSLASTIVTRLASAAAVICRNMNRNTLTVDNNITTITTAPSNITNNHNSIIGHDSENNSNNILLELPLHFLFHTKSDRYHTCHQHHLQRKYIDEDEELKAIKVNLLQILTNQEFDSLDYWDHEYNEVLCNTTTNASDNNNNNNNHSNSTGAPVNAPVTTASNHHHRHWQPSSSASTCKLLAVTAVNLAKSLNNENQRDDNNTIDCSDKFVPCKRRVGKLRKNCPSLVIDPPMSSPDVNGDLTSNFGVVNLMGVSLVTTTTTSAVGTPFQSCFADTVTQPHANAMSDSNNNNNSGENQIGLLHNLKPMINRLSILRTAPLDEKPPCWLTLKQSTSSHQLDTSASFGCYHLLNCFKSSLLRKISYTSLSLHDNNNNHNNEKGNDSDGKQLAHQSTVSSNLFNHLGCCQSYSSHNNNNNNHDDHEGLLAQISSVQNQSLHVLCFSTIMFIPILIILGFMHLLVMPRSVILLVSYSVATIYITLQLMVIGCFKRFKRSILPCSSPTICRLFLWLSVIVATVTTSLNMFLCGPIDEVNLINNNSNNLDTHQNHPSEIALYRQDRNLTTSTVLIVDYTFKEGYILTSSASGWNVNNSNSGHYCFFYDQFIIIGSISMLISGIFSSAALYATNRNVKLTILQQSVQIIDGILEFIVTPQLTRVFIGLLVFLLHIIIILWTTHYNGFFSVLLQSKYQKRYDNITSSKLFSPSIIIQPSLFIPNFVQCLFAQFAFLLLTVLLPRSLEYQCRLIKQWRLKTQSAVEKLNLTTVALARLLVSIVPRFVIARLSNPERTMEVYSKPQHNIGIVLIQFVVIPSQSSPTSLIQMQKEQQQKQAADCTNTAPVATNTANTTTGITADKPNDEKSKSKLTANEEPTQIADRIRLLNHVIHLVDSIALGQQSTVSDNSENSNNIHEQSCKDHTLEKNDNSNNKIFSSLSSSATSSSISVSKLNLLKIYSGGFMVGYAAGVRGLGNSDSQVIQSAATQWTCLIKFIEQVIIVCDQLNKKSNCQSSTSTSSSSSNGQIYVQAALHFGSCILGFVSSQHPVFTLWGEPLEICRQLLSKHQLTHLNSQHFILATDELISLLPLNLLNSSTSIGATSAPLPPSSSCSSTGVSTNLLNQHLFTWCTVDPTVGRIIPSVQLQRPPSSSLLKTRDGRPPFIDRLLHFCTVRSNNNSNTTTTTTTTITCNNSSSSSNTNNGNRNVFNVCQSELANTKSDKHVSSMLNTCCSSTPILVSNISSAHGIPIPIQQQVGNGQKENHPLDSNNFNVTNYHPLNNNTNSSPPPIVVTDIPNNDKRMSTTINAINHCTPNQAIISPTTDRQLVDDAFQSSTNHHHCQQQKRKSQPFLNATNITLDSSTVQFPHPQGQSLPASLPQPPPPPPHQRFYPSNTMHIDSTIHSQAQVYCVPSGSILVPYTVVSTVTDCTSANNNDKCNVSSHILNGSQQKHGFTSPSVIQKLSTANSLHTTTSISHENCQIPTSYQTSPAPQHVHSVSDKINSRNANQGFKPPVRPNSYWPVPDEISVDKLQTNHDNDSRKEKLNRPISAGIVKRYDGMVLNIFGNTTEQLSSTSINTNNCPRPTSLSSIDSFLIAERACAAYASGDIDEKNIHEDKVMSIPTKSDTMAMKTNKTTTTATTTTTDKNNNSQSIIHDWDHVKNAINQLSSNQNINNNNNNNLSDFFVKDEVEDEDDDDDVINGDGTSHHNPLYTDNEYESMAESQGNLLDTVDHSPSLSDNNKSIKSDKHHRNSRPILFATLSQIDPRDRFVCQSSSSSIITPEKIKSSHQDDIHFLVQDSNNKANGSYSSSNNPITIATTTGVSTNGMVHHEFIVNTDQSINSNVHFKNASQPIQSNTFDFPDYQRPSSPGGGGYLHEKMNTPHQTSKDLSLSYTKSDHVVKQQQINSVKTPPTSASSSTGGRNDHHHHRAFHEMMVTTAAATTMATVTTFSERSTHSSGSNSLCLPLEVNRSSVVMQSLQCTDHIIIRNVCQSGKVQQIAKNHFIMNEPNEQRYDIPYIPHEHSKLNSSTREPEGSDAEYMGTASLGPLSMAVLTSMTEDGLTSCDGDEITEDDDNDGDDGCVDLMDGNSAVVQHQNLRNSSNGIIHGMMTDSLLANPDLDGRDSELGEDFDYTSEYIESSRNSQLHHHHSQRTTTINDDCTPYVNQNQMMMNYLVESNNSNNNNNFWQNHIPSKLNIMTTNKDNSSSDNIKLHQHNTHMLLEAALLSTSTTPLSQLGIIDSSSNENDSNNINHKNINTNNINPQLINISSSSIDLDDLGNDEELFMYHKNFGHIGFDYMIHNPSNKTEPAYLSNIVPHESKMNINQKQIEVAMKRTGHHHPSEVHNENIDSCLLQQQQKQFRDNHSLQHTTTNIRPSLPEIAPVSLPNFSYPQTSLITAPWYSSSDNNTNNNDNKHNSNNNHNLSIPNPLIHPPNLPSALSSTPVTSGCQRLMPQTVDLASDYDNLYPNSFHTTGKYAYGQKFQASNRVSDNNNNNSHKLSSTIAVTNVDSTASSVNGGGSRPAFRKLIKAQQQRRHTDWHLFSNGEESDAMSGYIGDSASSVYDTGDDDDDTDDNNNADFDNGNKKNKKSETKGNMNGVHKNSCYTLGESHNELPVVTKYQNIPVINQSNRYTNGSDDATSASCSRLLNKCEPASIISNESHSPNKCGFITTNNSNNNDSFINELMHGGRQVNSSIQSSDRRNDQSVVNCTVSQQEYGQHQRQQQQCIPRILHRTVSIADSHTSGARSEYDNVDKSGSQTDDFHESEDVDYAMNYAVVPTMPTTTTTTTNTTDKRVVSQSSSPTTTNLSTNNKLFSKNRINSSKQGYNGETSRVPITTSSCIQQQYGQKQYRRQQQHSIFDAQIAAEARRISRQFRVMGWTPVVVGGNQQTQADNLSDGDGDDDHEECLINSNQVMNNTNGLNLLPSSSLHRPHLFLLPGSTEINHSHSRQTSLRRCATSRYAGGRGCSGGMDSETVTTVTSQVDDDEDDDERQLDLNDDEECDMDLIDDGDKNGFPAKLQFLLSDENILNGVSWEYDVEKWTYQNFGDPQLGCLLVRPRSLSATCLNILPVIDNSHVYNDVTDDHRDDNAQDDAGKINSGCNFMKLAKLKNSNEEDERHSYYQLNRQRYASCNNNDKEYDSVTADHKVFSPRLKRLQKRTAHVRNLLPPDLHRFILPGCMSSLSRSSSMCTSSHYTTTSRDHSGLLFLSLSRKTSYHRRFQRQRLYNNEDNHVNNISNNSNNNNGTTVNGNYPNTTTAATNQSINIHSQLRMPNSIRVYKHQQQQGNLLKFSIDNRKWASDPDLQLTANCQTIDYIE